MRTKAAIRSRRERYAVSGLGFLLAMLALFCATCTAASDDEALSAGIDDVTAAWRARRSASATFVFAWKSMETRSWATIGLECDNFEIDAKSSGEALTANARLRCVWENSGQIRLEEDSRQWSEEKASFVPIERVSVFYAGLSTQFIAKSAVGFPNAHIQKSRPIDVAEHMLVVPLRLVFRPLDAEVGIFRPDTILELGDKVVIGGRECIAVKGMQPDGSGVEIVVYADILREFLPIRYESKVGGKLLQTAEITSLKQTSDGIWVPLEWEAVRLFEDSGEPAWVDNATVEDYRVNTAISEEEFNVELPNGTVVMDVAAGKQYVVKAGNERRYFSKEEAASGTYEELINSNEGELLIDRKSESGLRAWMLTINIVAFVVLLALLVVRRRSM